MSYTMVESYLALKVILQTSDFILLTMKRYQMHSKNITGLGGEKIGGKRSWGSRALEHGAGETVSCMERHLYIVHNLL